MQATDVSHFCNFNFPAATLKKLKQKKKQVKLIFITFYLTQPIQNIVTSMCNQHKNYSWDILHFVFSELSKAYACFINTLKHISVGLSYFCKGASLAAQW